MIVTEDAKIGSFKDLDYTRGPFETNSESEEDYNFTDSDSDGSRSEDEIRDKSLNQSLYSAVCREDMDLIKNLLSAGASPNYVHTILSTTKSLLGFACSFGSIEVIKVLLEHGADPNWCDNELMTPLIFLCSSHVSEDKLCLCAEVLINGGAYINMLDCRQCSALTYAADKQYYKLAFLLIQKGIDIYSIDFAGWLPLTHAVNANCQDLVQLLICLGSPIDTVDHNGRTAYDIASTKKFKDIAKMVSLPKNVTGKQEWKINLNDYTQVMAQFPDPSRGKLKAFQYDVMEFMGAIGLSKYCDMFYDKNITLGEFLTFSNDEWASVGIVSKRDQRTIQEAVSKIHQLGFSQKCLNRISSNSFTLEDIREVLQIINRQLFYLDMSLIYTSKFDLFSDRDKSKINEEQMPELLEMVNDLQNQFSEIEQLAYSMTVSEGVLSCDYIGPKKESRSLKRCVLMISLTVGVFYISWRHLGITKIFSIIK